MKTTTFHARLRSAVILERLGLCALLVTALALLVGCEGREVRQGVLQGDADAPMTSAGRPSTEIGPRIASDPRDMCDREDAPRYVSRDRDGMAGGEISFVAPGTPRDLLGLLLDFHGDAGHRPWRAGNRLVCSERDRYRVEARYSGRVGINPTVVLLYDVLPAPEGHGYVVKFRVDEAEFGLKRFEGEYEVRAVDAGCSRLRETVFIDSGLPFVNASAEDVRAALHEDAKSIRRWMRERLATEVALRRAAPR
ncbi:MAG: hypothetical protein ACUVYA_01050 [Planctomycetota bacterium]